jgi:hypothetical protein
MLDGLASFLSAGITAAGSGLASGRVQAPRLARAEQQAPANLSALQKLEVAIP